MDKEQHLFYIRDEKGSKGKVEFTKSIGKGDFNFLKRVQMMYFKTKKRKRRKEKGKKANGKRGEGGAT